MNYTDYINKDIRCDCGRLHSCRIREIIIKDNAIKELTGIIEKNNYESIYIAADENTWKAAGKWTLKAIEQAARGTDKRREIKITKYIFKNNNLLADEASIATLLIHAPSESDLVIGIGTGTINDICKLISKKLKNDYAIVATAPSMDGFASNISMLTLNCIKTAIPTKQPDYIICDLRILCKSPRHMIASGMADIFSKSVSLTDWKLAELVNDEYYCSNVEKIIIKTIQAAETVITPHIGNETNDFLQNKKTIKAIMEALIMSGISKAFISDFKPLSLSEHNLLAYLQMKLLQDKNVTIPYGTGIAVSTVKKIKLYEKLKKRQPDFETAKESTHFDMEEWRNEIISVYGKAADNIIELEKNCKKNSDMNVQKRLKKLQENRDEVFSIITTLPPSDYIIDLFKTMDIPYKAKHIGISKETLKDSIKYAKELSNSYELLQLLYDLKT